MDTIERIYRAYFTDVYRYCLRLTGDADAAEELTSDTFFAAMQHLDRFRGDCELRVWLCEIAKNRYLSACRRQKTVPLDETAESFDASPEQETILHDDAERVTAIVHALPEPFKEVFLLRVYGEMSFEQIGTLFSKTANWACVTFHRAKTRVKSELEEQK